MFSYGAVSVELRVEGLGTTSQLAARAEWPANKVPAAQMYTKRFNALRNKDSVAVGWLIDCI
jgi:hypothetical protein